MQATFVSFFFFFFLGAQILLYFVAYLRFIVPVGGNNMARPEVTILF